MRADILAAPAGPPEALKVEVDADLFAVPRPATGRADLFPYAAAQQNQFWIVSGGRRDHDDTAAAIYGPEPVVLTPTLCFTLDQSFSMPAAFAGSTSIERRSMRPCAFWITPSNETRGEKPARRKPLRYSPVGSSDCP